LKQKIVEPIKLINEKNAFNMDNKMRSKIGNMFLTSNFVKQVFSNI